MTMEHLQNFKNQIAGQLANHKATVPEPGMELPHANGGIELLVGLNLMNQLILMEEALISQPPGMLGPGI